MADTNMLRKLAAIIEKNGAATMSEFPEIPAELRAAADTIEAARAEVLSGAEEFNRQSDVLAAMDRELAEHISGLVEAHAEVARLREAIEEMVEDVENYSNDSKVIRSVSRIARAALGGGDDVSLEPCQRCHGLGKLAAENPDGTWDVGVPCPACGGVPFDFPQGGAMSTEQIAALGEGTCMHRYGTYGEDGQWVCACGYTGAALGEGTRWGCRECGVPRATEQGGRCRTCEKYGETP